MINISTTAQQRRGRHFGRYRQIAMVLVKHRLGDLMRTFGLERFLPLHLVPPNYPWNKTDYTYSQRTRMALEELGTTFIKVGQILSTRTDVLPSDFTQELAKLQDSLPPFPSKVIEKIISDELGRPIPELFASFIPEPLGVASIGQAHAAVLPDGTAVVVKVHKPRRVRGGEGGFRNPASASGVHNATQPGYTTIRPCNTGRRDSRYSDG